VNLYNFWKEEDGQDLIEYTLLLAMVCLGSAAVMIGSGESVHTIWNTNSNNLASARSVATPN